MRERLPNNGRNAVAGVRSTDSYQAPEATGAAADLARLQRSAGNRAAGSTVAREAPTRAENIAALKAEVAAAQSDPSKWKDVAVRLNGFAASDMNNAVAYIPSDRLQVARTAIEVHLSGWPGQAAILTALDGRARSKKVPVRPTGSAVWAAYSQIGYNVWSGKDQVNNVWEFIGGSIGRK
ncbi:hypothetical protein AAFP35_03500 [Gordonia sp. CPCC 206044]|uniref:hypothetical protein n=1 Tax=Gordonia sp. CPCC 206044 TaxID=3140793 RepID=UPI003AF3E642